MERRTNSNPSINGSGERARWVYLPEQLCTYPAVEHLGFADKKTLAYLHEDEELQSAQEHILANRIKYQQFIRQKRRNPSYDIYACFQPFNECFKALFPFVAYITQKLSPEDKILNLWDRSGWTAGMLAGWFPGHEIITVWEGDKDILGYRGFDYWMSEGRGQRHQVVFTDFLRALPFESQSMGLIIGVDVLHRFHQPEFLREIMRIAKPEAPVIFPHVHLTNSMPEPFFDRGCEQLHGLDYQYFFDHSQGISKRQGYIVSEPETFLWNEWSEGAGKALASQPDNPDYNACIAWLPEVDRPMLHPWRGHERTGWQQMRLLENPLLMVNPVNRTIGFKDGVWGFPVSDFISKHPVYERRVANGIGHPITEEMQCVLYWAKKGLTVTEICRKTQMADQTMEQILSCFHDTDLAQAVPVDYTGFRLQTLLGQQEYLLHDSEKQLAQFWKQSVAWYADAVWCRTTAGEAFTYGQAGELVELVQKALIAEGIGKGDAILLCGDLHPELLLCFWAAVGLGVTVVPLSPGQASSRITACIRLGQPALAVIEPCLASLIPPDLGVRFVMLDLPEDPQYQEHFSFECWLSRVVNMEKPDLQDPMPGDVAVLLWTTGTTGNPKGIPITHEQLILSGRNMTETYRWKKEDRYYALGGLETMSGLRHATVAVAEVGASCILPAKRHTIFDHFEHIAGSAATILTANPSFYKQFGFFAHGRKHLGAMHVRLALCTGNTLTKAIREQWQRATGLRLYNYYGLTETSGMCIAEPLDSAMVDEQFIGFPVECLVKVIDENGDALAPGKPGELCIYGSGVFGGYFQNPQASANVLRKGWFYTGDLAIIHADGSIRLTGRLQDIVKLPGGERIEVQAIEEVLEDIDLLKDWAVCPMQQQDKESIAVFFVPETIAETQEVLMKIRSSIEEGIGRYAIPSIIEPVSFIPRGNHQKVLRKELLDLYKQLLENR